MKRGLRACSGTTKPLAPLLRGGIITMRGNGELALVPDTSRCRIRSSTGGCTSWAPRVPRLINLLHLVLLSFFFVVLFFFIPFTLCSLRGLLLGLRLGFLPVSELVRTQGDQL